MGGLLYSGCLSVFLPHILFTYVKIYLTYPNIKLGVMTQHSPHMNGITMMIKKFFPLSVIPVILFLTASAISCYNMNGQLWEKLTVFFFVSTCPLFFGAKYWDDVRDNLNKGNNNG